MENAVNERVKLLRSELAFTQNEMANELGISFATYRRFENETISVKYLKMIIERFNVNSKWLTEGEGEMFAEGGAKIETKQNGWRDEAYMKLEQYNESLKAEVTFLKSIVSGLLPAQKSFNIGAGVSGFFNEELSSPVRVRA